MATPAEIRDRLLRYPGGDKLFAWLVTRRAPYFASIAPRFSALRPGFCEVRIRNRRAVHNHLGTVNAIAMCCMAELAAGVMTDSTIDGSLRWIPRGMTVRYLARADTDLVAQAWLDEPPASGFKGDIVIPVLVRRQDGTAVMDAEIRMYISPRARAA